MSQHLIHTLDLHFRGEPNAIAVYVLPYQNGAVLVECGPASTLPALEAGLRSLNLQLSDISDALLTHIHLDHAGAAGWLAEQGVRIHVHERGAPHLIEPRRLMSSAARIYGSEMESLWGIIKPVPARYVHALADGDEVIIGELRFRTVETPGHASHHHVFLLDGLCFSGDIGGVRLPGTRHLRLPTPPPEIHLESWEQSIARLQDLSISALAPTHFGIYTDVAWHLNAVLQYIQEIRSWLERQMDADPRREALQDALAIWMRERAIIDGLGQEAIETQEIVNSSSMSADGLFRYWRKHVVEARTKG